MTMFEAVKEFLESSTIHGMVYISTTRRLVRLLWIVVVIGGFIGAGLLIQESFSSWSTSPVSTTIETLSISDLDFPNVTVCPPRNSFTSLIPDLVKFKGVMFDGNITESLTKAMFEANAFAKYAEFSDYNQEILRNWYTGTSRIGRRDSLGSGLPYKEGTFKNYNLETFATTGTFSTPYFRKETFDETKFERMFESRVLVNFPPGLARGSQITLDIEYDVEQNSAEEFITINKQEYKRVGNKVLGYRGWWESTWGMTLDVTKHYYSKELPVSGNAIAGHHPRIVVRYRRHMKEEYNSWADRRNTGMRLSWSYNSTDIQPQYPFVEDNQQFIQLANIVHLQENNEVLELLANEVATEKMMEETQCVTGNIREGFNV